VQGSLAIHDGVLWVGRHAMTAHVRPFDLDGRPLSRGFSFRDPATGRAAVSGLAVDPDHRIWTADRPASRVRAFTLFGREVGGIGGEFPVPATSDAALPLVDPVDVDVVLPVESDGARGDALLVVGSGGARRHAVRVFEPEGGLVASLRPLGDPQEKFLGVEGVAAGGRLVWVCEGLGRRVQVFRDLDFHFAFRLEERGTELRPVAAAPLDDGRVVVTCAGDASRLLLVDGAGRVERVLAEHGAPEGRVFEPSDVAVLEDSSERRTRVFVLDQDGDRVQVFNLEGRCYGAFESEAS
jgi:sugar lactone lactonase YvrE